MNEEIDENEFYQHDFTTASEWEIFIARIEEIIAQWKTDDLKESQEHEIPKDQPIWTIKTEPVTFVDFDFNLSLHRKTAAEKNAKNPFDSTYDFQLLKPKNVANHSVLSDWYGINEFIVLSPNGSVGVTSESKIKVLLSSLVVAAGNSKCGIPLFVQIREKWQQCYLGVYENEGIRTSLEMVHLKYGPRLCMYLTGLLELFRSKIVVSTMQKTISVSMQSTYLLQDFGNFFWKQDFINSDADNFESSTLKVLPFGVTIDPINSLILKVTWSQLSHRQIRDCESYSTFSPLRSSRWSILCKPTDQPLCLLGDALTEFSHIYTNNATVYDILGDFIAVPTVDNNPLEVLTEPKVQVPTISSLITRAARNSLGKVKKGSAPLGEDILVPMLYYLFPDAEEESIYVYKDLKSPKPNLKEETAKDKLNLEYECRGFKTCPVDSLLWRLATILSHCLQSLGGGRAFSYLWYEFVQEMRYRWEKNITIPGLLPGAPDLRTCLLHQKLQMLNCCIERKIQRENGTTTFDSAEGSSNDDDDNDDDDDEFFDCSDNEPSRKKEKISLWDQPVGRLGKFNNLKLIKTGDPLYIPITQEPVPKSEDQLEEDTNVLLMLGSDPQGSELRAKMMSASLLSDMESFKAANPGSILEDFIRWYSPRDWMETDELDEWGQKKGYLSSRMLIEDNFWKQTWDSAKPVPANRQKRLFDDTREAEKVLHYLDSRSLSQICELLVPVLCHCAIYKLMDEAESLKIELPDFSESLRCLIKLVEKITRENKLPQRRFESFIQEVVALELRISEINSLLYKFNPAGGQNLELSQLIASLVKGEEMEIEGQSESTIGKQLMNLFGEAVKNANLTFDGEENSNKSSCFPQPSEREVVLRVAVPRPASYSAESPQFLRAVLGKNEFRLVGAFSDDIVFF